MLNKIAESLGRVANILINDPASPCKSLRNKVKFRKVRVKLRGVSVNAVVAES